MTRRVEGRSSPVCTEDTESRDPRISSERGPERSELDAKARARLEAHVAAAGPEADGPRRSAPRRAGVTASATPDPRQPEIDAALAPGRGAKSFGEIGHEILRLRDAAKAATTPYVRDAIKRREAALVTEWARRAPGEGVPAPKSGFDPARATDRELLAARAWAGIAGGYPSDVVASGRTGAYVASLDDACALRDPKTTRAFMAAMEKRDPTRLRAMLTAELARMGGRRNHADEKLDVLVDRVASAKKGTPPAVESREETRRKEIGVDGYVGTADDVRRYEALERIKLAKTDTVAGTFAGGIVAFRGGDIDDIRRTNQVFDHLNALPGPSSAPGETSWESRAAPPGGPKPPAIIR
ncbi:MAG: hypothetical protein KC657_11430 [Myxococcales bacterium]|nr:hypothetical protein [Myxococcales bacterium]